MKPTKETRYVTTVVVEGLGDFPLDMLRYDSCWPATEADAHAMAREGERRQITLRRAAVNPNEPNYRRWASFGWNVLSVDDARQFA